MLRTDTRIYLYKKRSNRRFQQVLSILSQTYLEKRLILLPGAGTSMPSGLPGAEEILSDYMYRLFPDASTALLRKSKFKRTGLSPRFDDFFHTLAKESLGVSTVRQHMLAPYFSKKLVPNDAHFLSVFLWNQNRDIGFYTLNFDTNLEEAARESGIELESNPDVMWNGQSPGLTKLHGSWDRPDTLVFGRRGIKTPFSEKVRDVFKGKTVLGMGTSFNDEDVRDLLRSSQADIYSVDPYLRIHAKRRDLDPVQKTTIPHIGNVTRILMKADEFLAELAWSVSFQDTDKRFKHYLLFTDYGQIRFKPRRNVRKLTDTLRGRENWLQGTMYTDPAAVVLGSAPGSNTSDTWKGGTARIRFLLDERQSTVIDRFSLEPVELRLVPPLPFGKYLHSGKEGEDVIIRWRRGNHIEETALKCEVKTSVNTYCPKTVGQDQEHVDPSTPILYWSVALGALPPSAYRKELFIEFVLPRRTIMDFSRAVLKFA